MDERALAGHRHPAAGALLCALQGTAYLTAAQQALGIFQTPPPQGVRVVAPAGRAVRAVHLRPQDRILNGFIQALVGLRLHLAHRGPAGLSLFQAGDAEARALGAAL